MSFSNFNNSSNNNASATKKEDKDDTNFCSILNDINLFYKSKVEEFKKISEDELHLDNMFNKYNQNTIFLQSKELLNTKKDEIKNIIVNLEEQLYVIKRNFNIV
tara:strand:- start:2722 stop:3033 length:312 start_codon:yes stop_codon:yes gene_type:complete